MKDVAEAVDVLTSATQVSGKQVKGSKENPEAKPKRFGNLL